MKKKIIGAFLLLLALSLVKDIVYEGNIKNGYIDRELIGGEEKEVELQLEIEDILENYDYSINVSPELPRKEDAEKYFEETIAQIDKDFEEIGSEVPVKSEYVDGYVRAEWSFQPFGIIDEAGTISYDRIEEMTVLQAQVKLLCGTYERIYEFAFALNPRVLSKEERILKKIETWLDHQMQTEGSQSIELPSEIDGEKLVWSETREYITPKVLCLEVLALLLIKIASKRKQEEEEKKRLFDLEKDYPEIVNQLSLLIGAGMTSRQAWSRIAAQYEYKKKEGLVPQKRVYEAVVQMNRWFQEGESETVAYKRFTEEVPAPQYRKLTQLLLRNLEKGTAGIALRLEEESRLAFELKIHQAKKLGEEASTKMLLPLMLMLALVMGVVLLPALMKFQI